MKEKVTMRKAAAMHLRAIKELHSVTPRFFPVLTLYCLFGAITPYVTVFFSARILTELAMLRRAEILWRWVLAGVLCVGLAAIGKALLYRRYNTLLEDLYGRKDNTTHRPPINRPEGTSISITAPSASRDSLLPPE